MPPRQTLRALVWCFTGVTVLAILYLAVFSVWWPLMAVMLVVMVALRAFRDQINAILSAREPGTDAAFVADALTHRARDLDVLAGMVTHLEGAQFVGRHLVQLHGRLAGDGPAASNAIRRLHGLSELQDSLTNMAALPLALFLAGAYAGQDWMLGLALAISGMMLLFRPHLALAIERWRTRYGRRVRMWIDTIAEFEALSSLAGYRYEHPEDPFPEIVTSDAEPADAPRFEGIGLGHPLLPRATMVRNDVRLAGQTRLLVVSGSNMSERARCCGRSASTR